MDINVDVFLEPEVFSSADVGPIFVALILERVASNHR